MEGGGLAAVKMIKKFALQILYVPQQTPQYIMSAQTSQADRLVMLPSYLLRVEGSAAFCCTTVEEKGRKKRTEAQSISQEIVIPYVIDFHGISTLYCTYDTASASLYTHEDM